MPVEGKYSDTSYSSVLFTLDRPKLMAGSMRKLLIYMALEDSSVGRRPTAAAAAAA